MTKKFPSQIKYEKNNPTITFRMKKNEKKLIREMTEKTGESISQLVRMSLLELEKDFTPAYDKVIEEALHAGYKDGYEDGYEDGDKKGYDRGMNEWRIWFFCNVCGEKMYIIANSKPHEAIIECIKERGGRHTDCHE